MKDIKTLKLTSSEPSREFPLQNSISHIEVMEIRCLHLMDKREWSQELMKNELQLRIELSCYHGGHIATIEYDIDTLLNNTQHPIRYFKNQHPPFQIPEIKYRIPKGGLNLSHYDKMVITLLQKNKNTLVNVEVVYKDYLKIPAFSVRCFNCRNRNDYADSEINWEMEESEPRQMGVETMYSGEFNGTCNHCFQPLSVQFYYWEYPANVLNYHEHKAENCMVVENPNFIERYIEETD